MVFAGAGSINDAMNHFDLDNTETNYGGGLCFKVNRKENVNKRVDYSVGNGQQNIYFHCRDISVGFKCKHS